MVVNLSATSDTPSITNGMPSSSGIRLNSHRHKLKHRYEILRKLGQGTYGKVQLGVNKETGQEVAIKTIKKAKIETEQDLMRIRREIQIMSSVQHPSIIHIFEVFENRERIVLVMEFAAGGELYDYLIEHKMLLEEEARRIFRQIAVAVYYCHKHNICHRDLKLENILMDECGNCKIADFGLSNVFDGHNLLSTFCGSPLYASPEIVKGIPYYGPEVDCWSLGVLLYTLAYGSMPFDGSNFKRLVKQICSGDFYEPSTPSSASELIHQMLTVSAKQRANIEDICSHWWVNLGYKDSCLEIAEDLACQTPVRLDILLQLAPPPTREAFVLAGEADFMSEPAYNNSSSGDRAATSNGIACPEDSVDLNAHIASQSKLLEQLMDYEPESEKSDFLGEIPEDVPTSQIVGDRGWNGTRSEADGNQLGSGTEAGAPPDASGALSPGGEPRPLTPLERDGSAAHAPSEEAPPPPCEDGEPLTVTPGLDRPLTPVKWEPLPFAVYDNRTVREPCAERLLSDSGRQSPPLPAAAAEGAAVPSPPSVPEVPPGGEGGLPEGTAALPSVPETHPPLSEVSLPEHPGTSPATSLQEQDIPRVVDLGTSVLPSALSSASSEEVPASPHRAEAPPAVAATGSTPQASSSTSSSSGSKVGAGEDFARTAPSAAAKSSGVLPLSRTTSTAKDTPIRNADEETKLCRVVKKVKSKTTAPGPSAASKNDKIAAPGPSATSKNDKTAAPGPSAASKNDKVTSKSEESSGKASLLRKPSRVLKKDAESKPVTKSVKSSGILSLAQRFSGSKESEKPQRIAAPLVPKVGGDATKKAFDPKSLEKRSVVIPALKVSEARRAFEQSKTDRCGKLPQIVRRGSSRAEGDGGLPKAAGMRRNASTDSLSAKGASTAKPPPPSAAAKQRPPAQKDVAADKVLLQSQETLNSVLSEIEAFCQSRDPDQLLPGLSPASAAASQPATGKPPSPAEMRPVILEVGPNETKVAALEGVVDLEGAARPRPPSPRDSGHPLLQQARSASPDGSRPPEEAVTSEDPSQERAAAVDAEKKSGRIPPPCSASRQAASLPERKRTQMEVVVGPSRPRPPHPGPIVQRAEVSLLVNSDLQTQQQQQHPAALSSQPQACRSVGEKIIPILLEDTQVVLQPKKKEVPVHSPPSPSSPPAASAATSPAPPSVRDAATSPTPCGGHASREHIIPIALENGGFAVPNHSGEGMPSTRFHTPDWLKNWEPFVPKNPLASFNHVGRAGSRLGDLPFISREGKPVGALQRLTSFGKRDSRFSLPLGQACSQQGYASCVDPVDGVSSAGEEEEDEDDGFQILTAESLFSTLLSRVRSMTRRLNQNDPEFGGAGVVAAALEDRGGTRAHRGKDAAPSSSSSATTTPPPPPSAAVVAGSDWFNDRRQSAPERALRGAGSRLPVRPLNASGGDLGPPHVPPRMYHAYSRASSTGYDCGGQDEAPSPASPARPPPGKPWEGAEKGGGGCCRADAKVPHARKPADLAAAVKACRNGCCGGRHGGFEGAEGDFASAHGAQQQQQPPGATASSQDWLRNRSLSTEEENVGERILRKSYFSRFNEPAFSSMRRHRRSLSRDACLANLFSRDTVELSRTHSLRVDLDGARGSNTSSSSSSSSATASRRSSKLTPGYGKRDDNHPFPRQQHGGSLGSSRESLLLGSGDTRRRTDDGTADNSDLSSCSESACLAAAHALPSRVKLFRYSSFEPTPSSSGGGGHDSNSWL